MQQLRLQHHHIVLRLDSLLETALQSVEEREKHEDELIQTSLQALEQSREAADGAIDLL